MVTTFERLAKVINGYIKPANWIERAFASIGGALVPSYTVADDGKVLGVTKVEDGYDETVIVQEQSVTLNGSKRAGLAEGSYDFSSLSNNDTVYVTINDGTTETTIECTYNLVQIAGEGLTITAGARPMVTYSAGTANATYTIKGVTRETKYKAVAGWKAV